MARIKNSTRFFSLKNSDIFFACGIALFAAILAINELGANKYGSEEIVLVNERASKYQWYQSKSIKETILRGQKDLINSLLISGSINTSTLPGVKLHLSELEKKMLRYKKEKDEILKGSSGIAQSEWIQEIDGKLGNVIGAEEHSKRLSILSKSASFFELGSLFYQICLVVGAVGIILTNRLFKILSLISLFGFGGIGSTFTIQAYLIV